MPKRTWIKIDDATIAIDGYPVRVKMVPGRSPYSLEQDGREPTPYSTLGMAKMDAERRCDDLDEFLIGPTSRGTAKVST